MRFMERLRARRLPGHVVPPFLFRPPNVVFQDCRMRKGLSEELCKASASAHDRLIVSANGYASLPYNACLEKYVLHYMTDEVRRSWQADRFEIILLSNRMMEAQYAAAARRNGERMPRSWQYDVNGAYAPLASRIYVRECISPLSGKYGWQNAEDVCGHEMGHYIDEIFDCPSIDDGCFLDAYRRERHRLDSYSASDNREYFATTCWICRRYPEIARRYLPRTYRFFRHLFAYA